MATEASAPLILTTKLHRPPLIPDLVLRPRLIERLNQRRRRPLTLISAGAGYGKSTLASNWLETADCPSAWLSLDERDDDLVSFLTYFIAAVQTIFPEAGQESLALAQAPNLPPLSVLAASLANELDQIKTPFILVLDDYHHIRELAIHNLLDELLRHPPEPMHLVITTRRDPLLALTNLRARGQVTEIGDLELRFTVAETAAFLQFVTESRVDEAAPVLEQKTEGWVTGLRLSALSLRHRGDLDRLLRSLPENIHYVTDYLISEVLLRQSPAVQEFLLKTAILNRFCAPLADAVCTITTNEPDVPEVNSRPILERLQQENLFIIPLDDQRHWFRYHHLFQDLLQQRLSQTFTPDAIAGLRHRAGRWFAENDLIEEAIRHSLAAGDTEYVVRLIGQHRYNMMNTEQWHRLDGWLKMLPHEVVTKNPILLSTKAYLNEYHGEIAETFAYRDQAEKHLATLPPDSPDLKAVQGEIAMLRGTQYVISGDAEQAGKSAARALALLPSQATHIRSFAIGVRILAHQIAGKHLQGLAVIDKALKDTASPTGVFQARMMLFLCMMHWMEGDLAGLKLSASRCLNFGEQYNLPESVSFGRYYLGVAHYLHNQLSRAEQYLAEVVENRFLTRPFYYANSAFALALIYVSQNRADKAFSVVEDVISHATAANDTLVLATARAFQVELALRCGKIAKARQLSKYSDFDPYPVVRYFYAPQLTQAKLLLAENKPESLAKARTLLDPLSNYLLKIHSNTACIDVLALQALLHKAHGEEEKALEKLTESLALAEPGGFIRNFVDMGKPVAGLLVQMRNGNMASAYSDEILAAFPSDLQSNDEKTVNRKPEIQNLIEPLTNRELDVLELLAQRLSNKEIAQQLVISPETVKKHTLRIYQKLGVKSRQEAVIKAKSLSILPN